jgi:radical SAM peptide maturase (CXXX-repeat target family)/CXXX repeat peptide maturase
MRKGYVLGTMSKEWSPTALDAMIIVTEDCNLRCKYCYITHKSSNKRLDFETAKKFIDYLLSGQLNTPKDIILDFIGGEPFLEIDLIDEICDYFKMATYKLGHDWYWNHRFNFSTNGVNYSDEKVQKFLSKNTGKCTVTITIDGTKEKHDMHRVFPDGTGSYDIIRKNIPLYLSQFGGRTKATYASEDLKYLKDSVISLWNMGIKHISANVVFEDAWKDGDDKILESQLIELADYALENKLYSNHMCTFFYDEVDGYYDISDLSRATCGAGRMLALGPNGNIYPCIRYKDYSLNKNKERVLGNVEEGIDMEKVRPFMLSYRALQSDEECINCEIGGGCTYCQGYCYDEAATPTNFNRAKYICKMHKARVRANDYYFSKLYNRFGIERKGRNRERKRLHFILADDFVTHCQHENMNTSENIMSAGTILEGLEFARQNFFVPIFIHSNNQFNFTEMKEYESYRIRHIVPVAFYSEASYLRDCVFVFTKDDIDSPVSDLDECQLNIDSHDIVLLAHLAEMLFNKAKKININITNLDKHFDYTEYRKQLMLILGQLMDIKAKIGTAPSVNLFDIIIDRFTRQIPGHQGCKAGDRSFALSPIGELYVCPAYYSKNPKSSIGDIKSGITNNVNGHLYKAEYQPLCKACDAYQCPNCAYLNLNTTGEVNISPSFQCKKGHIERDVALQYNKMLVAEFIYTKSACLDPIQSIMTNISKDKDSGYYTVS